MENLTLWVVLACIGDIEADCLSLATVGSPIYYARRAEWSHTAHCVNCYRCVYGSNAADPCGNICSDECSDAALAYAHAQETRYCDAGCPAQRGGDHDGRCPIYNPDLDAPSDDDYSDA